MKINWKFIDKALMGEVETDDIPLQCKEEIQEFVQTHDMGVFSEESLEQLSGIWELSIKPAYEATVGEKIPNIFKVIDLEKEEEEDERETLSSGF